MVTVASPSVKARHLVYVDEKRTHEVHAQFAMQRDRGVLATTEFPQGSQDAKEVVHLQTPFDDPDGLRVLLSELEARLAYAGVYYRADAEVLQWAPVPRPAASPPDLRGHEVPLPGSTTAMMRFHHFHSNNGSKDRMLISMPRPNRLDRHILAQMEFEFPHVDGGEMNVLHTRLTPATLSSSVLREHIEAPRKGYDKLIEPGDYRRAFGSGWRDMTTRALRGAADLFLGRKQPAPEKAAPPPGAPADFDRMVAALKHARLCELKRRFVDATTEARLVEGGEHAIRRHIQALRLRHGHLVAYDLSVVEAALMLAYAAPAKMWDLTGEAGGKVLRYLYGYS